MQGGVPGGPYVYAECPRGRERSRQGCRPVCVTRRHTPTPSQLTLAQRGKEGPSRPHSDPAKQWPALAGGPLRPRSETFWVRS